MKADLLPLSQVSDALEAGAVSPEELLEASLSRIHALDGRVHAFLRLTESEARAAAAGSGRRRAAKKPLGPLDGVPVALKDIFCTEGVETTCGSKILSGYVPPYDATVVRKLKEAGAVIVGKLNMDEFAMGSSTENSAFGPTMNPWDLARTPGGSSGGSAAAVAARMVAGTLGTDTGGSIRQPASLVGCVGMKPTYGRVSRYGVIAFASSLDQVGPFAQDVRGVALLLAAIAGHDENDQTSSVRPVPDYTAALPLGAAGLRVGVPREYFGEGLSPEVEKAVRAGIDKLRGLGCEVHEISLPNSPHAIATYYIVATAEASSNLARYDGVRYGHRAKAGQLLEMYEKTRAEGFGAEVKRRIMLGTYALSAGYYDAYYLRAQKVRALIRRDFDQAFDSVDAVVSPTSPTTAFRLGEKLDDPLAMYLNDVYTVPANLAGLPGISLPCGFDGKGLPIGLQLIGKPFDEETLLRLAHAAEPATYRLPALVEDR
ncbi:MAG TPA: Asp-tRNA(Asn)/Glu-tRNA(Gln) amidotransferase subunit GatA [Myxococcales bacterium]|jgi:aspartyl-tRNA(Asn)/glutamyl-tRNA(Gln) amidotransferase subunit A|nr:Asp-tRNA(Asn)/Glu-tRNA(Gln) amidotransferase subunit GatA [Myxococcales bacterium]